MGASEIIDKVGPVKALLTGAALLFSVGLGTGLLAAEKLDIPADHERRISASESWIIRHDSLVTVPSVERIELLEQQVQGIPEIRAMVYELWCERFPERCNARPRRGEK